MVKQLHIWITDVDYERLKAFAAADGECLATVVRQAVRLYILRRDNSTVPDASLDFHGQPFA